MAKANHSAKRTPPFNALHVFMVTARHLNLTRAADELCVTQGAVSRQIANLESYLGFALFTRHARGLTLTQQGKALLPNVQSAFEQLLLATETATRENGVIHLKAPTCSMRWLVPHLMQLEKERPHINISLTTTTDHSVNFKTENFDAAIVYTHDHLSTANSFKLFDEAISPVIAPQLFGDAPEIDLSRYTLLHPTYDQADWQHWTQAAAITLPATQKNQYFDTMDLAISAAIQGFGIAMADITLVQEDIRMQRLVQPFTQQVQTGLAYYLVKGHHSEKSQLLDEFLLWLNPDNPQ